MALPAAGCGQTEWIEDLQLQAGGTGLPSARCTGSGTHADPRGIPAPGAHFRKLRNTEPGIFFYCHHREQCCYFYFAM